MRSTSLGPTAEATLLERSRLPSRSASKINIGTDVRMAYLRGLKAVTENPDATIPGSSSRKPLS